MQLTFEGDWKATTIPRTARRGWRFVRRRAGSKEDSYELVGSKKQSRVEFALVVNQTARIQVCRSGWTRPTL